jgi:hypothetical protein
VVVQLFSVAIYLIIFGFNRCESVKLFIFGLGRLDLRHMYELRKLRFIHKVSYSNLEFIKTLSHFYLMESGSSRSVSGARVGLSFSEASHMVYESFKTLVVSGDGLAL